MKKLTLVIIIFLTQSLFAAQNDVINQIKPIQKQWAIIKYRMVNDKKPDAYLKLANQAAQLVTQHPDSAEPLIWQAISLSSYAGAVGGLKSVTKALPAVKKARELLHQAEAINPTALDGSVYTSLGALYYQVPGWPIGFGDKKYARRYLEKAMDSNDNTLDAGYFYGDYLFQLKDYSKAKIVLRDALSQPTLTDRPLADLGRREEIKLLLENSKIKNSS